MGSSKKHKEKRDRKKHKRARSSSRDRDSSYKRSHKSSHRRERRGSDHESEGFEKPESSKNVKPDLGISDDEFDVDKLLDSKLLETTDQHSFAGRSEASELSIEETNRMRAKLGLKPLDVKKKFSDIKKREDIKSTIDVSKIREKLRLTTPGETESAESHRSSDSGKRSKGRERADETEEPAAGFSEPQLSLSIAETNKLRAKLGLKPLDVPSDAPGTEKGETEVSKPNEEVFVKTENISEKKKAEALREKLKIMKEKRAIEEKLGKTKGLADSDSEDDSAAAWVLKHQQIQKDKERAEQRAKLLEEMDAEFGISALVDEEFDNKKEYTSQNLKGLTIAHDTDAFKEGHQIILTLKDKGVLEEEEDVLENVNIVDSEKYAKNVENKLKKPDYRPYEEPEYDEFGILKKKSLLSKYDEEIEGEKKKSFKIGHVNERPYMSREQELELIRLKLKQQNEVSLSMPDLKPANEYYTAQDLVQFKKPKKRRKVQKSILKAGDLVPEADAKRDLGSRNKRRHKEEIGMEASDPVYHSDMTIKEEEMDISMESTDLVVEDRAEEELHGALSKARKLKQRKILATAPEKVMELLNSIDMTNEAQKGANIELNSVAEFCRTLGEIPTYGMSGNRDDEGEDMMELERELLEERQKQEIESQNQGAWNEVDIEEKPAEISVRENEPILEEEPDISLGLAGALKLATKKGYLDKDGEKVSSAPKSSQLQAQSYTIEEKFYEDDKFGKRDRYTGPVQEFKEKSHYTPEVKLEYIDDSGRILTSKEAFRYLSHKFHGKGPGKNKVDKRMKKLDQDNRLKQMSSTDTPLNTVKLLQLKQKETQSPYIVLSGGNKTLTQTMISKTKPV